MRVPVLPQQVNQAALPGVRQNIRIPDFMPYDEKVGLHVAQQVAGAADNLVQNLYAQKLHEANQIKVQDGINQIQLYRQNALFDPQNGLLNKKGSDAFLGSDGKSVTDLAMDDFQKKQSEIADSLGNDYQKAAFMNHSTELGLSMRGQLLKHETEQHKTYTLSTLDTSNQVESNNIGLFNNDPNMIRKSIDQIKANANQIASLKGNDNTWAAYHAQSVVSKALNGAITTSVSQGDHANATRILHDFAHEMNQDDMLKNFATIQKEVEAKQAYNVVNQTKVEMSPRFANNPSSRLMNIVFNTESGNRQFTGKTYGLRSDGTQKGSGYFGELKRPDGNISTELSIGVNIGGKETEIPTLVPTLSAEQKQRLLSLKDNEKIPEDIIQTAVDHAKKRIKSGLSPFHDTPQPLTSPAGAIGVAQVMPDTAPEAAKLAGLPFDDHRYRNDPAYNAALGTAYLQKQLQTYGGDLNKALAAYNGGPGRLDAAIKAAEQDGSDWLSHMPTETQNYVTKISKEYADNGGRQDTPTLEDFHNAALSKLPGNASMQLINNTRSEATRQYEEAMKAIKQHEEAGVADAFTALRNNGGNYAALPIEIKNNIPPEKDGSIRDYAAKVAKGIPVETDMSLFYQLKRDPALLAKTNLDSFKDRLSDSDFKDLIEDQTNVKATGTHSTQVFSAREVLNRYMETAGINPNPKFDDTKETAKVGRIESAFQRQITEQESIQGKKMDQDQIRKLAARMFTEVPILKWGYAGTPFSGTGTKPAVLIGAGDNVQVPSEDRAKIIDALTRNKKPITEEAIWSAYMIKSGIVKR